MNENDSMTTESQENTHHNDSQWDYFYAALMFYTRLPVPKNTPHSAEILNKSRAYFPVIGIIIGLIAVLTYVVGNLFFSTQISVALSMVATILATGAFHEDGFADSCDGLGGGWKADQVLTIMKDSRIGTYGSVGLISILGLKFLVLYELATISFTVLAFSLIAAHTVSRLLASLTIESHKYVQVSDQSKSKPITENSLSSPDLHASFFISAIPVLLLACVSPVPTLLALLLATIVAKLFARYSEKRIEGITGDILGAIQQLSELTIYLAFIAFI